jgi:hypothetical protein
MVVMNEVEQEGLWRWGFVSHLQLFSVFFFFLSISKSEIKAYRRVDRTEIPGHFL